MTQSLSRRSLLQAAQAAPELFKPNWDPQALLDHHDNFDNYNAKYHAWNSVRVGPKRDLIAGWAKAARARGLEVKLTEGLAGASAVVIKIRGAGVV